MPVSGLMLSFSSDVASHGDVLRRIQRRAEIVIGPARGEKLAVVVDTDSREQDRDIWQWLQDLPGITGVHLAFASWDEPRADTAEPPSASTARTKH